MRRLALAGMMVATTGLASATPEPDGGVEGNVATAKPTVVTARLDGAVARFTARFSLRLAAGENTTSIDLPASATVASATLAMDGVLHALKLENAEAAAATLEKAAHAKVARPSERRAVAVISSPGGFGSVDVSVLAPAATTAVVELEITAPTCFIDDARVLPVPPVWTAAIDPALKHRAIKDETCGAAGDHDQWIAWPARELAARAPLEGRVGVSAGRLALATDVAAARIEVAIAGKLSSTPPDLATVFVIDGSRSVEPGDLDAERNIIESYARNAPNSRIQVVAYARAARPLLPTWMLASQAIPRIDRELRGISLKNGSNADAGLATAATLLAQLPTATRRIVVLTDQSFPERIDELDAAALRALVPAQTVVHVVGLDGGQTLQRGPSDGPLFKLAAATEGMAVQGGLTADDRIGSALMLVRPISLDNITLTAPGWEENNSIGSPCAMHSSDELDEGRACTFWLKGGAAVAGGPLTLEGNLWGHHISRVVRPDPTRSMELARDLIGRNSASAFGPDLPESAIQDAARVVSSKWSLLATWGGTGGHPIPDEGIGSGTIGTGSFGSRSSDFGTGIANHTEVPHLSTAQQLRNALRICHAERARVVVTLETTKSEIVGVAVRVAAGLRMTETEVTRESERVCIEEAIWDVPLALSNPPLHATTELALGPL